MEDGRNVPLEELEEEGLEGGDTVEALWRRHARVEFVGVGGLEDPMP